MATMPTGQEQSRPGRQISTEQWLFMAAGAALIVYGAYKLIDSKFTSPIYGPGAIGLGLTLMPWRIVGLIGGIGLVALGGLRLSQGYAIEQAGLVLLLGVIGIAERIRRK
ncbi:MAG: hypothetical protein IT438_00515 [Phycisphaerales bacterium]|nr:hypothetical protein [Phycisphaerales bacterium]